VSFSKIFGVEIFRSFIGSNDHSYVIINVTDHFKSRVLYVHTSNYLLRIKFLKSTSPRLLSLVEVGSSGPTPDHPTLYYVIVCRPSDHPTLYRMIRPLRPGCLYYVPDHPALHRMIRPLQSCISVSRRIIRPYTRCTSPI
jgi:hypothetical protein